jgi:hypothetical protein
MKETLPLSEKIRRFLRANPGKHRCKAIAEAIGEDNHRVLGSMGGLLLQKHVSQEKVSGVSLWELVPGACVVDHRRRARTIGTAVRARAADLLAYLQRAKQPVCRSQVLRDLGFTDEDMIRAVSLLSSKGQIGRRIRGQHPGRVTWYWVTGTDAPADYYDLDERSQAMRNLEQAFYPALAKLVPQLPEPDPHSLYWNAESFLPHAPREMIRHVLQHDQTAP